MVDVREQADALLANAGLGGPVDIEPLPGGANNRVYRLRCADKSFLLKHYFQHADDRRDRLAAEFAFCEFANRHGIAAVPRPVSRDDPHDMALYEFIEGRPLAAHEVTEAHVTEAVDFFTGLNAHRASPDAAALPVASEACFTVSDHLACIDARMTRLQHIRRDTPAETDAAEFVAQVLAPAWTAARREAEAVAAKGDQPLAAAARCLSPSDFGFHNALLEPSGSLRFIDFEYAGWDDPAKMVCDFYCQVARPPPPSTFRVFVARVAGHQDAAEALRIRIRALMPVYHLKWCAILLNEFMPAGRARRAFAGGESGEPARKEQQLQKARQSFAGLDAKKAMVA